MIWKKKYNESECDVDYNTNANNSFGKQRIYFDYIRGPKSHNNRQTTFVHPLTRKSDATADGIRCPSPPSYRNDTSFGSNTSASHDHRKQGSKRSSVGSWVKGPGLRGPKPATVTHKGWLFKQGSDGLQFWKRRWFVLSEYCLYYYKGPEEDKVLGYIPLPSFRISPAAPEDRVYRRHVFKAEHDNTRSYFFAADTKEQMTHWMNALSLASILQRDTSLEEKLNNRAPPSNLQCLSSVYSSASPTNYSTENSDSGFDGHNIKRLESSGFLSKKEVEHTKDRTELRSYDRKSFGEGSEESRTNTDCLNTSVDSFLLSRPGSRQPFYANAPPKPKRLNTSYESPTPESDYKPNSSDIYSTKGKYSSARKQQPYPTDRRTPEAYGATSVSLLRDDYEDVYGEQREVIHRKKLRRVSQSSLQSSDRHLLEELNTVSTNQDKQLHQISRRYYGEDLKCRQPPPRPHSADFLEYEYKHSGEAMWNEHGKGETMAANQLDIRPKSSVGYHEGDFWSEENYAAKMRESAIYNSYLKGVIGGQRSRSQQPDGSARFLTNQSRVPPAGASSPDNFRANTNFSPVNSIHSCKSEGSPLKNSPTVHPNGNAQTEGIHRKQSFSRSASARLPRNTTHNDTLNSSIAEDFPEGDNKREESMKRLLEWKQRMLQSPLTRKSNSRPESSASSTTSSSKMNAYHCAFADTSINKARDIPSIKELKNTDSSGIVSYHKYNPSSAGIRSTKSVVDKKNSNRLLETIPPSHQRPATQGESAPDQIHSSIDLHVLNKDPKESDNLYSNTTRGSKHPEPYYSNQSDDFEGNISTNEKGTPFSHNEQVQRRNAYEYQDKIFEGNQSEMMFSHDYVNLTLDDNSYNREDNIRAEPANIDEPHQSHYNQESTSNDKNIPNCNTNLYATRDPYYVTDVQMPAKINERKATNTRRNLCNEFEVPANAMEADYQNTNFGIPQGEYLASYPEELPYTKHEKVNQLRKSAMKNDDNNSIGKYSDSGYDTLRHDHQDKEGNMHNRRDIYDKLWADEEKVTDDTNISSSNKDMRSNWPPEKFEKSWTNVESGLKLDENDVIKEYSYEYITPEKNEQLIHSQVSHSLKKTQTNLASLESPKIVQETQQATSTNFIKDKIKSFSSLTEQAKLAVKELADVNSDYTRAGMGKLDSNRDCLEKQNTSSNAEMFGLNYNASSKSTVRKIQEDLHDPTDKNISSGNFGNKLPEESLANDARFNPNKIRNFIFNEEKSKSKENIVKEQHQLKENICSTSSVKELLRSYQLNEQNHIMESTSNNDADVTNETRPRQNAGESNLIIDQLPPPPVSFLEEIRANNLPIITANISDEPPARPPKNFITRNSSAKLNMATNLKQINMYESFPANNEHFAQSAYENDGPPKECAPPPPITKNTIMEGEREFQATPVIEDDYLPMSPPKIPFTNIAVAGALSSSSSSLSSKHMSTPEPNFCHEFRKTEFEEHTYIEMPGEVGLHANSNNRNLDTAQLKQSKYVTVKNGPESPRYYEIGEKDGQHYEYISKQGSHYESIYMEVNSVPKEICKDEKPEVPIKPFNLINKNILCKKSPSESALHNIFKSKVNSLLSEGSSDADDETYKDLDSLIPPRKPRFSLSDTFRPASYYLSGMDPSIDPDGHDSSDSDLVSPPPIPIGLASLAENQSEGKVSSYSSRRNSSESQKSRNSEGEKYILKREEKSPAPKYSSKMNKEKRRPILEHFPEQNNEDDTYVLGSEDIYPVAGAYRENNCGTVSPISNTYSHRKLSQHESDVSLLAEDGCTISVRSTSALSLSLPYHSRNNSFQSNKYDDDKSIAARSYNSEYNFTDQSQGKMYRSPNYDLSAVDDIRNSRFPETSENICKSPITSMVGGRMSRCSSNASFHMGQFSEYGGPDSYHMSKENIPSSFHQRSLSELSNSSVNSPQNTVALPLNNINPIHIRETSASSAGSEYSPRSAPYYYSDVIREEDKQLLDASLASYRAKFNQLNNQRELEGGKRQDIGRKVNPITSDQTSPEAFQRDIKTSFDFFDKSIELPNELNVYESDTLRRLRTRALTPDQEDQYKNLYSHGLALKTDDFLDPPKIAHRRTRSLEGILDESILSRWKSERDSNSHNQQGLASNLSASQYSARQSQTSLANNVMTKNNDFATEAAANYNFSFSNNHTMQAHLHHSSIVSLDSNQKFPKNSSSKDLFQTREEKWEDDGEWREKLRRASLRHSRSLETLDDPRRSSLNSSPFGSNRHKPTLSLLNECSNEIHTINPTKSHDEYHVDYREGRVISTERSSLNEAGGRARNGFSSMDKYEWDTSEEKFRMPISTNIHIMSNSDNSNPTFLDESLPASSVMNQDVGPKIPPQGLEDTNHPQDYTHGNDGDDTEEEGRRETYDTSNTFTLKPDTKLIWKDDFEIQTKEAPDIIPSKDIAKFGDSFPRRLEYNQQAASETNSNYGFGQNYISPTRPYAQNAGHHYKSDDPHYSSRPPPSTRYPYDQERYQEHTYQNYRTHPNDILETVKASPYHNSPTNGTARHSHYNQYRDPDYNSYEYNYLRNSDNDYNNSDVHNHSQADLEFSMEERQHRYRPDILRKYYHYSALPNACSRSDRYESYTARNTLRQSSYYQPAVREPYIAPVPRELPKQELRPAYRYLSKQLSHPQPLSNDPASDLYEPQGLLGGVSAGELLGKTHEELVLLLIQLRRHQSALLAARKHTSLEKESQERLIHLDSERGEEHFTRITYLDEHLVDLDKQYQMGKPLINLVDNMVKLGSLYTGFDSKYSPEAEQIPFGQQDSLQFSRRILERRILDEDRSKFDSVAPNQNDLEEKVMQLYKLERRLGEESLSIQDLQRKKEMLERTLYDLHRYSYRAKDNAIEVERRSRQRDHMERELARLRSHLAVSARRLEETAVENNRLEHEMMMLRQKIQSNMTRNLNSASLGTDESQHIESEMLRVQSLLEELQKRRMDLSHQINRLTSTSEAKTDERFSPTGVSLSQNMKKRNHSTWMETDLDHMITKDRGMDDISLFTSGSFIPSYSRLSSRTDNYNDVPKAPNHKDNSYISSNNLPVQMNANRNLDNSYGMRKMQGLSEGGLNNNNNFQCNQRNSNYDDYTEKKAYEAGLITALDRNSEGNKPDGEEQIPNTVHIDINEADDRTKRFYGLLPKEKALEPKTVRVVKRESTERKRDRFPSSKKEVTLSYVHEDDTDNSDDTPDSIPSYTSKTASLPRNYNRKGFERLNIARSSPSSSSSMARPNNLPLRSRPSNCKSKSEADCTNNLSDNDQSVSLSAQQRLLEPTSIVESKLNSTPVFKSVAAQEIVKEMTWEADKHRRLVPKEKRRHFTISSSKPVTLEAGHVKEEGARSRDDCDMVRALRPRNHPDVVKSTLSTRDVRFNEHTIDTLFGAPNKIHIPERYKPDEDDERELSSSEKLHREEKANAIRKMLAESSASVTKEDNDNPSRMDGRSKSVADKKERERILSMNQLLAKQVMEKSRIVAARAARSTSAMSSSSDDFSADEQLALVQQRENLLV